MEVVPSERSSSIPDDLDEKYERDYSIANLIVRLYLGLERLERLYIWYKCACSSIIQTEYEKGE